MDSGAWQRLAVGGLAALLAVLWLTPQRAAFAQETPPAELQKRAEQLAHFALFDKAAETYAKLLAAKPDDAALRLALAEVCYRGRRFAEAERAAKAVIQAAAAPEQKALAHACLGDVARKQARLAAARAAYEAAKGLAAELPGTVADEARARAQRGLGFLGWSKAETRKTIVCVPPDSPMKDSAERTAQFLDTRVAVIEKVARVPFAGKLEVYIFQTPEQWKSVLGDYDWESRATQEKAVYMMAGRTFYNLMRTLSFYLGSAEMKEPPRSTFVTNGFAGAFCGSRTWGQRILRQTSAMKQQGSIPRLDELLRSMSQNNTTVALGASFVGHLTRQYGDEKFAEFWKAFNDDQGALVRIYRKPVQQIQEEWLDSIR